MARMPSISRVARTPSQVPLCVLIFSQQSHTPTRERACKHALECASILHFLLPSRINHPPPHSSSQLRMFCFFLSVAVWLAGSCLAQSVRREGQDVCGQHCSAHGCRDRADVCRCVPASVWCKPSGSQQCWQDAPAAGCRRKQRRNSGGWFPPLHAERGGGLCCSRPLCSTVSIAVFVCLFLFVFVLFLFFVFVFCFLFLVFVFGLLFVLLPCAAVHHRCCGSLTRSSKR